jgi:hypothetical protein
VQLQEERGLVVDNLNTARQAAGLIAGGQSSPSPIPGQTAYTESWNGTSWTEIAEINTNRMNLGGTGSQTDGIIFGGDLDPGASATTEYWNGTSWTEINDLSTARVSLGSGGGSSSSGLAFGGNSGLPVNTAATEEFSAPALFTKSNLGQVFYNSTSNAFKVTQESIPAGTWSSGGALNTARGVGGSMGTQTAALVTGGSDPLASPGVYGETESYNGSAWTEVADLNTPRKSNTGTGTQTAAITSGKVVNPSTVGGETESWNGSSWTSVNSLNTARGNSNKFFAGTQSASLHISGQTTPSTFLTNVESWDGTNWTEIADVNSARRTFGGAGTQTAALIAGSTVNTEIWNGSTWTEVNNLNTARAGLGSSGTTNTAALVFGGGTPASPPVTGATESWDGTSWTEVADLATARDGAFSAGSSTTALAAGADPASTTATEEWNVPTVNSTLTAS